MAGTTLETKKSINATKHVYGFTDMKRSEWRAFRDSRPEESKLVTGWFLLACMANLL